jgi:hypothetical protein
LGLDFSATELSAGRAAIMELKLSNIQLEKREISDSHPELGIFDYAPSCWSNETQKTTAWRRRGGRVRRARFRPVR